MPVLLRSDYAGPADPPLLPLNRAAGHLLRASGHADAELSLLLVDDRDMAVINQTWLHRSGSTNVISFGQGAQSASPTSGGMLGDIVISVDTARREAAVSGQTLGQRLLALLVHGFTHLLGFDHELGPEDEKIMTVQETRFLDVLNKEKVMADLCINIDHIATVRQARGTVEPDPVLAAGLVELAGADGIVVHLREDRRHMQDRDVEILRKVVKTRLTLEMAATEEMIGIASTLKPDIVTLVPEKRKELTTEGGLDVARLEKALTKAVKRLHDAGVPVSLFVDPEARQIEASARTGADCIEIHTGRYADAPTHAEQDEEFDHVVATARLAKDLGLRVHAGHGLNYLNVARLAGLSEIEEFSIGHAIIARAVLVGLERAVREMMALVKKGHLA